MDARLEAKLPRGCPPSWVAAKSVWGLAEAQTVNWRSAGFAVKAALSLRPSKRFSAQASSCSDTTRWPVWTGGTCGPGGPVEPMECIAHLEGALSEILSNTANSSVPPVPPSVRENRGLPAGGRVHGRAAGTTRPVRSERLHPFAARGVPLACLGPAFPSQSRIRASTAYTLIFPLFMFSPHVLSSNRTSLLGLKRDWKRSRLLQ